MLDKWKKEIPEVSLSSWGIICCRLQKSHQSLQSPSYSHLFALQFLSCNLELLLAHRDHCETLEYALGALLAKAHIAESFELEV